ncbi:MAG: hypothetical protein NW226_06545 [Microscillaceae bacterium]|nr:hypothetical protein [Microscillaceae bacterium]
MTEEQELLQDTEQLKQLISQVDNSGISAWDAGDLLKVVKDKKLYIKQFGNFENYTKKSVGINPQTANNYIVIREKFTKDDIGNFMFVTHLRVIAEIENKEMRAFVLKTFKEREEKLKNNPQNEETYKTKLSDIVGTVTMVLESGDTELKENEIEKIIEINIAKGKEEARKRKRAKRQQKGTDDKALFGNQFSSEFYKDVSALLENEPINEMGVVALFCIMFQSLRGTQFTWKNETLTFVAIKYIRAEFPDACIRCRTTGKIKKNFELDIEFEFESYNYIRHRHMKSTKNCDLIICWEDNAKTDEKLKDNPTVKKMPPIISLKNCFETGEIELIN